MINSLTGCDFNAKQVERVCLLYGGLLDEKICEAIESGESKAYLEEEKQEIHYAMIDGVISYKIERRSLERNEIG